MQTSPSTPEPNPESRLILPKYSKSDFDSIAEGSQTTLGRLYVVWSDEKKSVLHDPMTNKPVHAKNPEILNEVARVFKGRIITAKEARDLLLLQSQN